MLESWKLNVLSFGDEEARSMGIKTKRVRLVVIFTSTLTASCSVAVSGIVGWVGLVIPTWHARLLATVEIPISILTSILGVPFFICIFTRNQKGW